ncbi:hypothetical protein [Kribbella sp. NBC_00889]|uniref:hypothetical protein n=1 Tax=Kribbella sp. NBC_00889 TaxID=2975974 RepID=UPI00386AF721|nr:hypothetical protein OG817_30490 [Kribbella sp. NBC_00889]
MAETWDVQQLVADGYARVDVELDWVDGPRAGLVDVEGATHYFQCYDVDGDLDEYVVWPASEAVVALEREQWEIFVRWNQRYEAGSAGIESHPAHGGLDARFDELAGLLAQYRQPPPGARHLVADWRFDAGARYRADGTDYWVCWSLVSPSGE